MASRYRTRIIDTAVSTGEIPPVADVELIARIGPSLVLQQQLASGTVPESRELTDIVGRVLLPLLKSGR